MPNEGKNHLAWRGTVRLHFKMMLFTDVVPTASLSCGLML